NNSHFKLHVDFRPDEKPRLKREVGGVIQCRPVLADFVTSLRLAAGSIAPFASDQHRIAAGRTAKAKGAVHFVKDGLHVGGHSLSSVFSLMCSLMPITMRTRFPFGQSELSTVMLRPQSR